MSLKKEQLSKKLKQIFHVYLFAQDAYFYTEYFYNPSTDDELQLVTKSAHQNDLSIIMHLMFRTLIVETSKLFSRSESDRFQIRKFIKSLSQDGYFGDLGVPINQIENWLKQIETNNDAINDIILLRNKLYAHTENPLADYSQVDISFKKLKILLDIAKEIISSVYINIFDTGVDFNSPTFDRERFGILKLLAQAESQRIRDIYEKYGFSFK